MFFRKKKEIVLTATTMTTLNRFIRIVEVLLGERCEMHHVTIECGTSLYGRINLPNNRSMVFVYDNIGYLSLDGVSYQIGTRDRIFLVRNDAMTMPDSDIPAVRKGTCASDAQLVPLFG